MPNDPEGADALKQSIANYKRTRRLSAPALHRWLDVLIRDAEQRLAALNADDGPTPAPAPTPGGGYTDRLDATAPRQRPSA